MGLRITAILMAGALAVPFSQAADTGPANQPSANDRMQVAREAIKAQDWKKALAQLKLALREEPRNADVHNLLGYSYRKQATPDLAEAFEHYNTALRLDPRHKGAHEYIGEAYLIDNKPAEAQKHLTALAQICGNTSCEEYADLAKSIADYKVRK